MCVFVCVCVCVCQQSTNVTACYTRNHKNAQGITLRNGCKTRRNHERVATHKHAEAVTRGIL